MGKEIYSNNMYLKEFKAIVTNIGNEKYINLDQTAFYPKSGGVDCDTGSFKRISDGKIFKVVYTGKFSGKISHEVDIIGLKKGDKIEAKINWERRYELMRYHTAAHVLSGIFYKEGKVKVTGNNLVLGKGRIDFNFPNFNREIVEKYVKRSNEVIQKDLKVKTFNISRKELDENKDLMKLAMGLPKSIKNVRIVEIENFDKQPDGGCHISHLNEIGTIKIIKIKNKGKDNRRLYFNLD